MSSRREREKRERRDSRGDKREGQGRKKNMNESETEEFFNVLGFNDTSTLVGHFMMSPRASPREREKRDSRGDKREGRNKEEQE